MNDTKPMTMPNIDIANTTGIKCPHCGCEVFDQGLLLRMVSPVLTGTGQPGLVPVTAFVCVNCHKPLVDFLPEELKSLYVEEDSPKTEAKPENNESKVKFLY